MEDIKRLGKILKIDPVKKEMNIKLEFTSFDQLRILEELVTSQKSFTFYIKKATRRLKTFPQLKRYFAICSIILEKLGIFPDSKNLRVFDEEIVKRTILKCDYIEIDGKKVPVIPSKAEWTQETIGEVMEKLQERYAYLGIDWSKENWYE